MANSQKETDIKSQNESSGSVPSMVFAPKTIRFSKGGKYEDYNELDFDPKVVIGYIG